MAELMDEHGTATRQGVRQVAAHGRSIMMALSCCAGTDAATAVTA